MPHILKLEENIIGNDNIVGDIHGELATFEKLLSTLNPNDRLFIVGDLIDRGNNSLGVIEKILSCNESQTKACFSPQIYSVHLRMLGVILSTIYILLQWRKQNFN
jgi:Icc-related predicted phosphoesterase